MSKTVQPSSIERIKRLAKVISKRDSISHSKALDTASGFEEEAVKRILPER
ncbi:hypothetical protein [Mesorhizobium sp.]|uniref:hypothetical protein n=1 Tax=Mesorhizobium sp. TaxID=1871066 RepID=UPI0025ECA755|nr:hypothetical protein [Mesorhizobium sp.]